MLSQYCTSAHNNERWYDCLHRPVIASTLFDLYPSWPQSAGFSQQLISKLVSDMEAVLKAMPSDDTSSLRRFLGYSSCIAASSRACSTKLKMTFQGLSCLFYIFLCPTCHEQVFAMQCFEGEVYGCRSCSLESHLV